MAGRLTPKQELFVREYLVDLNATQAAIRAGYSPKTAHVIGNENLNKPEIQTAISVAKEQRAKRVDITADRVLQELAKIAFADVSDLVEQDEETGRTRLRALKQLPGGVISEITERPGKDGPVMTVKLWDKGQALAKLGQHLGLFDKEAPPPPAPVVNVNLNLGEIVREEMRRVLADVPRTLDEIARRHPIPPPPPGVKVGPATREGE